ncbi:MAG: thiol:disulfide interchange protein DsbA/DsbL [Piscinibacter sp.]|uniref:thiol:disulfide interchange protein DsbA/DsbL n=1 Tax=Piscinibacter sp. TaxID=1903157 RepID=UPI002590FEB1|nr:thiol:disulfide interchange protein DsbA/DsbL [Piscinibacter sp.]MCW5663710.1 thiol:disulfide interchange protein DsbA/DsbL [Piscinibacter sp.]
MDRRQFAKAAAASLATAPLLVAAQERPVEGKHYVTVSPRQPTRDVRQVEVLEFFAYGCSHCHAFEPAIDAWQKKLPSDVLFRRIPVAFREGAFVLHQKLFFAIETLGLVEQLHRKVFMELHGERQRLEKPEEIADFAAKHGVDRTRLLDTLNSFAVATRAKQASALAAGYKIDGTPSIGVDGRWLTAGSMAGTNERSLAVAEYLVGLARKSA